jgi:anti-sigma-K factor RskA
MSQEELDRLEDALRQLRPAAPPPELLDRLRAAEPVPRTPRHRAAHWLLGWRQLPALWRALTAGAAAAAVLAIFVSVRPPGGRLAGTPPTVMAIANSNAVQVGHSLLVSFDAVAQLPGGAPVRFHCREWQDNVVIRDPALGMEVTQTTPRVEVIPVGYEIY